MGVAARPRCRSSGAALTRRAIALQAARKAQHRRSARADTRWKQQLTQKVPLRADELQRGRRRTEGTPLRAPEATQARGSVSSETPGDARVVCRSNHQASRERQGKVTEQKNRAAGSHTSTPTALAVQFCHRQRCSLPHTRIRGRSRRCERMQRGPEDLFGRTRYDAGLRGERPATGSNEIGSATRARGAARDVSSRSSRHPKRRR